jgi:hypothetical protein
VSDFPENVTLLISVSSRSSHVLEEKIEEMEGVLTVEALLYDNRLIVIGGLTLVKV